MKIKVLAAVTAALAASAGAEQKLDVFVNNGERIPLRRFNAPRRWLRACSRARMCASPGMV